MENITIKECIEHNVELEQLIQTLEQYINLIINGVNFDYVTEAQNLINQCKNKQEKEELINQIKQFFQKYLNNGGTPIEEIDNYLDKLYKNNQILCEKDNENEEVVEQIPAVDSPEFEQMCNEMGEGGKENPEPDSQF